VPRGWGLSAGYDKGDMQGVDHVGGHDGEGPDSPTTSVRERVGEHVTVDGEGGDLPVHSEIRVPLQNSTRVL